LAEQNATVGPYEIVGPLARGGMAEVWLARWSRMGAERLVVIKRLLPWLADDADLRAMFAEEIRLCAALDHPGIVRTYDVGEWEGLPFLVLEYIDGAALDQLLADDGPFAPAEAVTVAVAVAEALAYAHARSPVVVHRDVSPSNVLVDRDGRVRLADFGIAKVEGRARTMAGTLKGKLAYMAPEQVRAGETGPAVDQYALGLVLFELLTGEGALPGGSDAEIISAAAGAGWNREHPLWLRQDGDLRAIIGRALHERPQDRWPDVRLFGRELEAWAARRALGDGRDRLAARLAERPRTPSTAGPATSPRQTVANAAAASPPPVVPPDRARRRGFRRMALLATLNILAAGTAWWVWSRAPGAAPLPTALTEDEAPISAPSATADPPPPPAARRPHAPAILRPKLDAAPLQAPARLTVQVTPWAHIDLGDGEIRTTPLFGLELPSGTRHIRLWNPDAGWERSLRIDLEPDKETRVLLALDGAATETTGGQP
jgi:serine/threonine-protein kinase